MLAGAVCGAVVTVTARSDPGAALGFFVVAGTVVAVLTVRPRAVHLIIPVPALSYLLAALVTGYLHDHAADVSRTDLAISAAQWIAGGFIAMAVATALAIIAAIIRRPSRVDPDDTGHSPPLARRAERGRPRQGPGSSGGNTSPRLWRDIDTPPGHRATRDQRPWT